MKRTLSLVALAAVASLAADIKYGVNVEGLVAMPSIDADGIDAKIGFGGNVGAGARVVVAEKFSVRPAVGFELVTFGAESKGEGYSFTSDVTQKFLTIGCGLEYSVMPNLFVAVTPEYDLTLGGTAKTEVTIDGLGSMSDESDVEDEKSPFLVGAGLGYNINEKLAVTAGYKLDLTGYSDDTKLNKVSVGVRYEL